MTAVAGLVVVVTGLGLLGMAMLIVVAPARAERFLSSFAGSARAHYLEQTLRIVAGSALLLFAEEMRFTEAFRILGWLVVGTSAVLVVLPWKWHERFGRWAVPLAIRNMKLYAFGAFALGAFILYAAYGGTAGP